MGLSLFNLRKHPRKTSFKAITVKKCRNKKNARGTCPTTKANRNGNAKPSILNLDDDYLFTIFGFLNIWHLLAAEKVCRRFKSITEMVYKIMRVLNYERICEEKLKELQKRKSRLQKITLQEVKCIAKRLGPYIHTLYAHSLDFCADSRLVLKVIFKEFTKLRNLHLHSIDVLRINELENSQHIAKTIVSLELECCVVDDAIEVFLQEAKKLETLSLIGDTITGKCLTVLRDMKQITLNFDNRFRLSDFIEFCERNQGLKSLSIANLHITNEFFEVLVKHLKSLECLRISYIKIYHGYYEEYDDYQEYDNMLFDFGVLGDLTCLKNLEIICRNYSFINLDYCLFKLAAWNTLECVDINPISFSQNILRALCIFTNLKVLKIRQCLRLDDEHLIQMSLSKNSQSLQELEIVKCYNVKSDGLVMLVKNCPLLKRIKICPPQHNHDIISKIDFIDRILPFLNERPTILEISTCLELRHFPSYMLDQLRHNAKIKLTNLSGISLKEEEEKTM